MRTANQWLDEYGESHRHPVNKLLHWICVPAILLSGLGLLWSLPVPDAMLAISPWLNWATLAAAAAIVYYLRLSPVLAGGIALGFLALLLGVAWLDTLAWPLWRSCVAIFVIAWIGQFIGHAVEGRRPSFFKDLQFLLIGPLWLVSFLCRRFGLAW
ncbi:MAG: Mpo1-like protein [Steroidobacteraceae bacterium]